MLGRGGALATVLDYHAFNQGSIPGEGKSHYRRYALNNVHFSLHNKVMFC